ncbi:DEAD/DEAH box helicase [Phenylobacterium sp.]|uniref:DEAD/DEAH box helicase n=1 Tax=Phenylobacterium sp. TaxID=1871053 RepID=UPI00272F1B75|nr:DEAD/DEAH box helicase [Phenylobacterium sp.]MDP1598724.1 DEAD/DEAH box helicase [Phenylobacterium sp.]
MKNWFGGKSTAKSEARFLHAVEGDDLILTLVNGLDAAPASSWPGLKPEAAQAIWSLQAAAEDARTGDDGRVLVEANESSIRLRPSYLAALDTVSASAFSLPPPTNLGLDLKSIGRIDQDDFHLQVRWVRPGGQPARADLNGALLTTLDGLRRLPEPLWSLHNAATRLASPLEKAERFKALADLRAHWPDDPAAPVDSDLFLRDLRVHYASSLSLRLRTLTPNCTEFDPVLFGARSLADAEDLGRSLDEELDNVLTPAAQKVFAEHRFRREPEARPVYLLRDGEYVFIDPGLQPALNVVRKLQERPEAERRAFVLNPRRVLREHLGHALSEEIGLDALFVETDQFSGRVAGVDVWRAPVLPWLTPIGKNQWLPERFGLRIGEDYFSLPPENVLAVIEQVEVAAAAGHATAPIGDLLRPASDDGPPAPRDLPINEQTIDAVRSLAPFALGASPPSAGLEEAPAIWDGEVQGKLFLVVRENFEEVEYAPLDAAGEPTPSTDQISIPDRLRASLKLHQRHGLIWLAQNARARRPGALLADDMGLGKTLQAIAFMAWLQDEAAAGRRPSAPFLIVAPTGLLGTWRDEIAKHLDVPRLGSLVPAFGSDLKSLRDEDTFGTRDIETGRASLKAESWRAAGVVLTTYETLRDYHFSFARTRFGLIVYDEIQKLKNPTSQMTRAAKALNSTFTLGMTGTPVENRLQDLWSIMDVLAPGLLGASRDFERRHPSGDSAALARLKVQLTEGRSGQPAYMLRRLKSEALEGMPQKHIHTMSVDMPPVQAQAYRDVVMKAAAAASGGNMGKGGMLSTLASMRGVSLHPLDPRQAPADLDIYARDSARLFHTLKVLDEVAAGRERALIFVEDLAMQERLSGLIQARFKLPSPPMRINGSVPGHKRQGMVTAFQQNHDRFDVMILSPKAGGVGLTLTAANHVIHLSRWWNPAVEDQATDRVFRIGQTKDVHVYLPLAVHPDPSIREASFDLRLNALIERKRQLTRDLFLPPDASDAELSDLFREVSLGAEVPSDSPARQPDTVADAGRATVEPRAVLSLPKVLVDAGVRHWRCEAGAARPTEALVAMFAGKDIVQVAIRDPYALARSSARQAQVRFLVALKEVSRSLGAVTIEYAPEAEGDADDGGARRDLGAIYSRAFGGGGPRLALNRRSKRSRDDDFHDRFVEIDVRHAGGAIRRYEVTIGRGVEALFDSTKQCTVTYAPPSAV